MKDMTKHMDAVQQLVSGIFKLIAELSPDDMDELRSDLLGDGYDANVVAAHMEVLAACLRDTTLTVAARGA